MMWFNDVIRLLVISLVLTTWACDPVEVPEPKEEDPPFWSEIELDDTNYEWTSGKSSIFNFSNYEAVRGDGIRFSSILQHDSCDYPCPSSFRIDLFGPVRWRVGQMVNPAIHFSPAERDWFRENEKESGYVLNANLMPVDSPTTEIKRVVWSLNGEVVAMEKQDYNDFIIDTMKQLSLCVDIIGEKGIKQQICHSSHDILSKPLNVQLIGTSMGRGAKLIAIAKFGEGPPYSYYWNDENSPSSHMKEIESIHDTMSVKLKVVDKNGTSVTIKNTVHFGNVKTFPVNAGLVIRTKKTEMPAPLFNKASIRWVDREGREFSTAFGVQPPWASFRIESFEPFRSSVTGGEPMAKVVLAFKGVLYREGKPERAVRRGKATMLFSYPK